MTRGGISLLAVVCLTVVSTACGEGEQPLRVVETEETHVRHMAGKSEFPASVIAPDGSQIIVPRVEDGEIRMYLSTLAGDQETPWHQVLPLSWSPDGEKIAVAPLGEGIPYFPSARIGVASPEVEAGIEWISAEAGHTLGFRRWSESSQEIYVEVVERQAEIPTVTIAVVDLQTKERRDILTQSEGLISSYGLWSMLAPEAGLALFATERWRDHESSLWSLDLTTGQAAVLSSYPEIVFPIAVRADGRNALLQVEKGQDVEEHDIWLIDVGTPDHPKLRWTIATTGGDGCWIFGSRGVAFSPDGSKVAFQAIDSHAYVADLKSGELIQVPETGACAGNPTWISNDTLIVESLKDHMQSVVSVKIR